MIVEVTVSGTFEFDTDEFFSDGESEHDMIEGCKFMSLEFIYDETNLDIEARVVSR